MTNTNHSLGIQGQLAQSGNDESFSVIGQDEFFKLAGVVIANTNDIVVITDVPNDHLEPRIVYVNEAFIRETGYSLSDVLGKNPRMLQGPRSDPETKSRIFKALGEWKHVREEILNYKKNGEEFWQELNIIPIANEAGTFTYWVSIQRDITERKLAEKVIFETNNRLQLAARAGSVGIWDFDFFNNRLVWDDQMCKLYGITRDQFNGSYDGWASALHPQDRDAAESAITKALEGASEFNTQFRILWPDGSVRVIRGLATVERDEDNKPLRMVGTNWDITELIGAKVDAEAALNVKTQFLMNMSHEIRTPMTGIIGLSTLALYEPLSPVVREYLLGIESSAKLLLEIVNDILDFSKLEANKARINAAPFSIEDLFVRVRSLFLENTKAKGLQFNLFCDLEPNTQLIGDFFYLSLVINNLIGNAIKFTEQGSIDLSIQKIKLENSIFTLHFSVKDTGIGISPESQKQILDPFSQADGSISRRFGGTGLGLTISNRILELMGSTLNIDSTEGRGSTFSFDLVIVKERRK
ncbi:PAS domain-containing protein [Polynucleobacter paneuropaeus]|uniref:Virulence sensor protein BvgS n=2 Tax=Polynucleobacter paneuropaeus TaxID=2527775 RepID=A0A2Z4JTI0_9BURK|nr:PAS domain-containing protein [Polynucleobacter paneuropaeus]AWW49572.1 hypothetical protein Pas1_03725 [Polynucleobacter paneuropaeus]